MDIETKHLAAKVFTLKGWINQVSNKILTQFFEAELKKANFNILNFTSNQFPNGGFTAIWILAESHLALHSFVESGWTYFELTSCNKSKSKIFVDSISKTDFKIKFDKNVIEESKA